MTPSAVPADGPDANGSINAQARDAGAPLAGIRILTVEQIVSLPYATQLLARLGADVVKIEHPVTGDSARNTNPMIRDWDGRPVGAAYMRSNLHKKSIGLDLKSEKGREIFRRLAERFDVVADNLRPGTMARLGLGPSDLLTLIPRLIYLSVSGFGSDPASPYYSWPAYAPTVEAMGGFGQAGTPGQPPRVGGIGSLGDIGASLFACIGTLAALRFRDETGIGQHIDVAMLDSMVAINDSVPFMWALSGRRPDRTASPTSVLGAFKAADGYFVMFARESQFPILAALVGHDEWLHSPDWDKPGTWRDRTDSHIRPAVEAWASTRTRVDASGELCRHGIAAGPANAAPEIASDPHVGRRRMLESVERPDGDEPLLVYGNPIKFSVAATKTLSPRWPALGQHTQEVLAAELGLTESHLKELAAQGVITASDSAT